MFDKKKYQKAQEQLIAFINEEPFEYEVRDALFYLGEIKRINKEYYDAISYYNKLEKRYPHSRFRTEVLFSQGYCYYYMNLRQKSLIYFKDYLSSIPDSAIDSDQYIDTNMMIADIYRENHRINDALKSYQDSLLIINRKLELKKNIEIYKEKKKIITYQLGMIYASQEDKSETAYDFLMESIALGYPYSDTLKFLLRSLSMHHIGLENGLPDLAISDIQVDGDDVWIATWGGGLVRYSRSSNIFAKINVPSDQLRNIYVDFDTVYISSYDGIFVYDKKSSKIFRLTSKEKMITLAQKVFKDDRSIYFSTLMDGVVRYDTIKKDVELLDENSYVQSRTIYSIEGDHRYIVFGTVENGVIIRDKEKQTTEYLNVENGKIAGNNIKSLLIDGRFLWIGIHKVGVYRYDLSSKKIKFFELDVSYPSSMAIRGKEVWIGTSGNGIRIINRETNKVTRLDVLNGLKSNEIHHIKMEENHVWIGYLDNGVDVIYRPENLLNE